MHQSLMVCPGVKLCIAILLTIWSSMFMTRWSICPLRILSLLLGRLPILREWKESYPLFRQECVVRSEGETMDKNAPRFYSTVSWYGKTLHSCSPPVHRMTYEWHAQERERDSLHADCGLEALRLHDHRIRRFPSERFTVRASHLPSTSLLFDFVLHQDAAQGPPSQRRC